jgi:hypothetical protein
MLRLTSAQFVAAVHGLQLHWIVNLLSAFSLADQHRISMLQILSMIQQLDSRMMLLCVSNRKGKEWMMQKSSCLCLLT